MSRVCTDRCPVKECTRLVLLACLVCYHKLSRHPRKEKALLRVTNTQKEKVEKNDSE